MANKKLRWGAIIPAGGKGVRMKDEVPKQLMMLGHSPILIHAISRIASCPRIEGLIIASPKEYIKEIEAMVGKYGVGKVHAVVEGADTRQGSVAMGLKALSSVFDYVLIHDGVRPLVDRATIDRVLAGAQEIGAATAAVPVQDTLAKVDKKSFIGSMPSRAKMWQIQTPQAFWRPLLQEAHEKAWADAHIGTDDAGLVARLEKPVKVVEGSPLNLKVTTKQDLKLAEALIGIRGA